VSQYVLATANPDKAREMRDILAPLGIDLLDRPPDAPDVEETQETLEGNALLKARALVARTGLAAIADDTGLFVDALDGRPGVRSARYAGEGATYEQNVTKLLAELDRVDGPRTARFRTVIAVAWPAGTSFFASGVIEGVIAPSPIGAGGFGYDPVFAPVGANGRTLAQLSPEEKNERSHRALALRALVEELAYLF
jgi:XTP/dITP diphosphohydrolase